MRPVSDFFSRLPPAADSPALDLRAGTLLPDGSLRVPATDRRTGAAVAPARVGPDHPLYAILRPVLDPADPDHDLFDRDEWGNGNLHASVRGIVRTVYLYLELTWEDVDALRFAADAPADYPLLYRVRNPYEDAGYTWAEFPGLLAECSRAIAARGETRALRKVRYAARHAERTGAFDLLFLAD